MPETKNNNVRHLIWIGCAIALCVSIAVFFWVDAKLFAEDCTQHLDEKNNIMHQGIDQKLDEIRDDLKFIKEKL